MQQKVTLKLLPSDAVDDKKIKNDLAQACAVRPACITGYTLIKKSLDARSRQAWFQLTFTVFINEPYLI